MTNKEKALDHVRSVCQDLKIEADPDNQRYQSYTKPVHLEHWLLGINPTSPVRWPVALYADNTMVIGGRVLYNLTKPGDQQSEDFYKAYNEIVGV